MPWGLDTDCMTKNSWESQTWSSQSTKRLFLSTGVFGTVMTAIYSSEQRLDLNFGRLRLAQISREIVITLIFIVSLGGRCWLYGSVL